ncbi:MAG: hypothetical protein NTY88_00495 [Bacteroidetes bacterium]|nr:hypothetical protein [Bacteroidota bacterium]
MKTKNKKQDHLSNINISDEQIEKVEADSVLLSERKFKQLQKLSEKTGLLKAKKTSLKKAA